MATLQGMVWFISSSVSMIRPLKSFIKIISVSTFWIMKRRRKQLCSVQLLTNFICWLFFRVTGLLRVVSLLWPTSAVLRELNIEFWNRWSVQKEKKQTYSNSGCPFFFFWSGYLFLNLRFGYVMFCFIREVYHWIFSEYLLLGFLYSYFFLIQQLFHTT